MWSNRQCSNKIRLIDSWTMACGIISVCHRSVNSWQSSLWECGELGLGGDEAVGFSGAMGKISRVGVDGKGTQGGDLTGIESMMIMEWDGQRKGEEELVRVKKVRLGLTKRFLWIVLEPPQVPAHKSERPHVA
ncbi:hypothetical protein O181_033743 [Austropuccinia psidii MF-1]|uniref:Uncharacterized protein n=1 Tax=Austropuccinia psidii MF-1 TaxID=1389203 RepID=A0A9Q3D236_9BASI|nr:hypothetical protein [Austropuccinia psidii MF-1]